MTLFLHLGAPLLATLYLVRAGLAGGAAAVEVALVGHELLGLVDGAAAPGAACRAEGSGKLWTTVDSSVELRNSSFKRVGQHP